MGPQPRGSRVSEAVRATGFRHLEELEDALRLRERLAMMDADLRQQWLGG